MLIEPLDNGPPNDDSNGILISKLAEAIVLSDDNMVNANVDVINCFINIMMLFIIVLHVNTLIASD
ncbi:TPA: hypothetical protein ACKP8D_000077 [Pseudomonas putida]|nr:hypothetical protein [Pseudomonas aeruginosa]